MFISAATNYRCLLHPGGPEQPAAMGGRLQLPAWSIALEIRAQRGNALAESFRNNELS